jgi:MYXO-CTERM domain-containing protein
VTPRLRATFETALIVTGLAAMAFLLDHQVIADAAEREKMLTALLADGDLLRLKYSIVGPLFAAPLWWLGKALGDDPRPFLEQYNVILLALAMLALYGLLRRRVDRSLLRSFFLLLLVASMFAAHVTGFNGETFTALTVAVGSAATMVGAVALGGWLAVALGVVNTPATAVGLALLVGQRILTSRRWRYVLALIGTAALVLAENWIRRGRPMAFGYDHDVGFRTVMPYSGLEGYSYPLFLGLLSLLFSFGKGLLFFAPGLFLPVRRSLGRLSADGFDLNRLYWGWVAFLAGLLLAYAPWWAWYGGLTWGPRFLLFASVPASFALAVRLRDLTASLPVRFLTLAVLALSTWVGICAAAFPDAAFAEVCARDNYAYETLCHFTPDFSVLWYPFVGHMTVDPGDWFVIAFCVGVAAYLAGPLVSSIARDVRRPESLRWRF